MLGMVSITMAYETLSAAVQTKVAHSALSAMPPTKYAAKTAVMTTVVYPELAKSYIAQPNTSRLRTPGFRASAEKSGMSSSSVLTGAVIPDSIRDPWIAGQARNDNFF